MSPTKTSTARDPCEPLYLCPVDALASALPQADVVDSKPEIEKACHSSCVRYYAEYEKCKERIAKKGEGSCEPWAFDYWKCIDKCVSPYYSRDMQVSSAS